MMFLNQSHVFTHIISHLRVSLVSQLYTNRFQPTHLTWEAVLFSTCYHTHLAPLHSSCSAPALKRAGQEHVEGGLYFIHTRPCICGWSTVACCHMRLLQGVMEDQATASSPGSPPSDSCAALPLLTQAFSFRWLDIS